MLQRMQITLAYIGGKDGLDGAAESYLKRCSVVARCRMESHRTEAALLAWLERQAGRTPAVAVLLDSRGKQMSSESFAEWVGQRRDEGTQHMVFAVGPADGWSDAARDGRSCCWPWDR